MLYKRLLDSDLAAKLMRDHEDACVEYKCSAKILQKQKQRTLSKTLTFLGREKGKKRGGLSLSHTNPNQEVREQQRIQQEKKKKKKKKKKKRP